MRSKNDWWDYLEHRMRSDSELYHHGVLGQKWGIRRYQSYSTVPRKSGKGGKELGAARQTKNEKVGMARFDVTGKYSNQPGFSEDKRYIETDFRKDLVGNMSLDDINRLVDVPKSTLGEVFPPVARVIGNSIIDGSNNPYPREKGFDGLVEQMNPGFGEPGTTNNCCFCAAGMEIGSRGFDIVARRSMGGCGTGIFERWFDGAQTIDHRVDIAKTDDPLHFMDVDDAFKEAKEDILSYGNGSSGALIGYYSSDDPILQGSNASNLAGHALHWRNENGNVIVADGQNGEEHSIDEIQDRYMFAGNYCTTVRLDNCTPNWDALAEDGAIGTTDSDRRKIFDTNMPKKFAKQPYEPYAYDYDKAYSWN